MKRHLLIDMGLAMAIVLTSLVGMGFASQEGWLRIQPVGESFAVLMPTRAKEGTRIVDLGAADHVTARLYYSIADGKRYLVMPFRKTSSESTPHLTSFDVFIKGVERSLGINETDSLAGLVFDRELRSNEGNGRQYKIKLRNHKGVARLVETEKVFYAVMVIGAGEDTVEAKRFMSSFAPGSINPDSESTGVIVNPSDYRRPDDNPQSVYSRAHDKPNSGGAETVPPEPWPRVFTTIHAGVLNGKTLSLPKPEHPNEARDHSGTVEVWVVIDEQGKVIMAEVLSGPSSLSEAALKAAWKARFRPTKLRGQPTKVSGRVTYNFRAGLWI